MGLEYMAAVPTSVASEHSFCKINLNCTNIDLNYIISSNATFRVFENEFLRKLILETLKVPSTHTFRYNILPQILKESLKFTIEAQPTDVFNEKEILNLGFMEIVRGNSVENIQDATQKILNEKLVSLVNKGSSFTGTILVLSW
ncbi:hypothetical protein BpHYR1_019154 [Brachionus plicatilis]|uniref:Uncharacterized protein n=1 Tax=Brachionus plicatilis TaxID=10195 RepID=A0A3M7PT97_BRAPC|nr:hypothetical protein BpHYR1_019154 [Brachionus plicatilis]